MDKIKTILAVFVSLLVLSGFTWGIQTYLETTYAKSAELKRMEQRLDAKILEDRLSDVTDRMWKLEDRYYKKEMPETDYEQYRRLKEEKHKLEEYLKEYNKEVVK